ncbi:MAG: sugar transferase [Actinobacteria bacterium]|nr:sugar transferase [Actinomycetota bacterium]
MYTPTAHASAVRAAGLQEVGSIVGLRRDSRGAYHAGKRLLDLVLAVLLLIVSAPLLAISAVAIRLHSRGPVIFRQERLGGRRVRSSDGDWTWVIEPFTLYKFRTMRVDADQSIHRTYMQAYLLGDQAALSSMRPNRKNGESYRPANDERITRVGGVLRRLSLDELPQLWNVFRGEMSFVGPRPPIPYEIEMYQDHHLLRLAALPGMTGWAQVKGRCTIGFEEMTRLDLEYLLRRSLWFDLKVLMLTVPVVLSMKGAD